MHSPSRSAFAASGGGDYGTVARAKYWMSATQSSSKAECAVPRIFIPSRGAAGVAWEEGAARMASDDEDHERMQALCDEFEELCRQLRYHQKACVPRARMTTSAIVLSTVRPTRLVRHPP
jgi:hypothetical protein